MTSAAESIRPSPITGTLIRRRKRLLRQREQFLAAWQSAFPSHDPVTARLRRYPLDTFEAACDRAEAEAATRPVDPKLQRLRRLLEDDISFERAWRELNDPNDRSTPAVVVEAIWHSIRERGLSALDESANKSRLQSCDAAARAELKRRIALLGGGS